MPWVRFTKNFDWQPPNVRWMVAYKAGGRYLVKQVVAEKAVKEGKAVYVERPPLKPVANAKR
jgi:hypothetical protein